MALVKCPQCGRQVSDMATQCGYCGADMPQAAAHQSAETTSNTDATPIPARTRSGEGGSSGIMMKLVLAAALLVGIAIGAKLLLPSRNSGPPVASQGTGTETEAAASPEPKGEDDQYKHILDNTRMQQPSPAKKTIKTVVEKTSTMVTKTKEALVAATEKLQENQEADEQKKAELLQLLQEKLAAAEARQAKIREAQTAVDAATDETEAAGKASRRSRTNVSKAKGALFKAERTLRSAKKDSTSARLRADRANTNNSTTASFKANVNQIARAAEAKVQAAVAAVDQAKTALSAAETAHDAATKAYDAAKARQAQAEDALDLVSEKELSGPIAAVVGPELLLLRQQRGGEVLHIVDGEEIRKPIVDFNIALMMSTEGLNQGDRVKVIAVRAGTWLPEGKTDPSLAVKKYDVVDRLE